MLTINLIVAGLVVVLTALQSSYPDSRLGRSRAFKVSAILLALTSAILMTITTVREDRAQERVQAAVEGISPAVFPQDVRFTLSGSMNLRGSSTIRINVFAIPAESPFFRRWPVTHTPNEFGLGQVFERQVDLSDTDVVRLIGAQGVDYFSFGANVQAAGEFRVDLNPTITPRNYRTIDGFRECQFVCVISGEALDAVTGSTLVLKGMRVPFVAFTRGTEFVGSTVFRPTYDRYFH